MRSWLLLTCVLLPACWGSPVAQAPSCERYTACIRALDALASQETDLGRFVEGGFCWNNETLAQGCTRACTRALDRMTARTPALPKECQP